MSITAIIVALLLTSARAKETEVSKPATTKPCSRARRRRPAPSPASCAA